MVSKLRPSAYPDLVERRLNGARSANERSEAKSVEAPLQQVPRGRKTPAHGRVETFRMCRAPEISLAF